MCVDQLAFVILVGATESTRESNAEVFLNYASLAFEAELRGLESGKTKLFVMMTLVTESFPRFGFDIDFCAVAYWLINMREVYLASV